MLIPKSLLRRLYVRGSIHSVESGFEFTLENELATATLVSPLELKVGGEAVDLESVVLVWGDGELKASEINRDKPFRFQSESEVVVRVLGREVSGKVKVEICAETGEYGRLCFDFEDEVS